MFDLSGRLAIITGGAGLLGIAHASALLAINCNVDLWDISSSSLEKASQELRSKYPALSIETHVIDITKESEVSTAAKNSKTNQNVADILINNAALNPKFDSLSERNNSRFEDYSLEVYENEVAVGLTGALLCSKHIGALMAERRRGVILNIASDLSVIAPDHRIYEKPGLAAESQFKKPVSYSVIKSGLIGLTRYLATYWGESGVRVNALSPGGVFENQDSSFVEKLTNLIPMKRMATIEDYMGALQFLCSDASSYMTGQNVVIDGGRSVW